MLKVGDKVYIKESINNIDINNRIKFDKQYTIRDLGEYNVYFEETGYVLTNKYVITLNEVRKEKLNKLLKNDN